MAHLEHDGRAALLTADGGAVGGRLKLCHVSCDSNENRVLAGSKAAVRTTDAAASITHAVQTHPHF